MISISETKNYVDLQKGNLNILFLPIRSRLNFAEDGIPKVFKDRFQVCLFFSQISCL